MAVRLFICWRQTSGTEEDRAYAGIEVTMNFKAGLPENLYTFLREQGERFEHSVFITQVIEEIRNALRG